MLQYGASQRWWRSVQRAGLLMVLLLSPAARAQNAQYSLDLIGISSGTAYTLHVDVGSGSTNEFRLIADTGSYNDAVLGAGCCGDAQVTFSCAASPTCTAGGDLVTLQFAGATIAGHFVSDKWASPSFGTITKDFMVIESQDTFYRTEYDGITGLAYKALGNSHTSFYENLVAAENSMDAFGMLLCGIMQPLLSDNSSTTSPSSTDAGRSLHAGQLLVGGIDGVGGETLYSGPMLYTPIAQEAWYVVVVSDVGFDGKSLDLPCSEYNDPQAIIDSGTSNLSFPPDVYNALMDRIKAATKSIAPNFDDSYFDYQKSCCLETYCDPSNRDAILLSLPSIYITVAMQQDDSTETNQHYTIEIPPEYYFRPEMNGADLDTPCRAIGIQEGSAIVLGSVLMDGLYTYHDRVVGKIGMAVADNCPNGVVSTKKLSKSDKTDDWCDCFSDTLKSKSSITRMVPWGSGCFFVPWWLYVVVGSGIVVFICIGVLVYWYWSGRRAKDMANNDASTPVRSPSNTSYTAQPTRSSSNKVVHSAQGSNTPTPDSRGSHRHGGLTDQGDNYSAMESPRELLDSKGSSIALLPTPEAQSSARHQEQSHQRQMHHNKPGQSSGFDNTASDRISGTFSL